MYVALTRAERYLYVSSSKPSAFFTEVEQLVGVVGGEDAQHVNIPEIKSASITR